MSGAMASRISRLWSLRPSHKYTKMETQDNDNRPAQSRPSFDECLNRIDSQRFTQWPNFTIEDELSQHDDRQSIKSAGAASTAQLFTLTRSPLQQPSSFFQRIKRMCTCFPVRDMSWLVGVTFSFGSVAFVINGFFLLLPTIAPTTVFSTEAPYATPASSVVGTLIFLVGGWAGVLEALNLERGGGLTVTEGVALEMTTRPVQKPEESDEKEPPIIGLAIFNTSPSQHSPEATVPSTTAKASQPALFGSPNFIHWPKSQELRTFYLRNLCFLAGLTQL
jgi:hypothetical protein